MNKKIIKIILIVFFLLTLNKTKAQALSQTITHLIFNKTSFEIGEEIKLTINLENFSNLNETKIIIKCNNNTFIPIKKNESYGQLLSNSIYSKSVINEYVNGGYIRFQLHKDDLNSGFSFGYKNNIGEFYFESRKKIDNIYDYFTSGNFEMLETGINVSLIDIYNQPINNTISYSEKIKILWEKDKYNLEVYDEVPNFIDDIKVTNRLENEYEIGFTDSINNTILGSQVITITIFDYVNKDYFSMSKVITVVDTTAPVIRGSNKIYINDNEIDKLNLNEYYNVDDNYDLLPKITIKYYNNENIEIKNYDLFIDYLKHHLNGKVIINASDESNNISDDFSINVSILDVTAPNITILSDLEIKDVDVCNFNFEKLIDISDNYDSNPMLFIKIYKENQEIDEYKKELEFGNTLTFKYYGIDNSDNKTNEIVVKVIVKDTTPPIIFGPTTTTINDNEIYQYDFLKEITITDNLDNSPKIIMKYFINEEEMEYEKWLQKMSKGYLGTLIYYGFDNSNNKTDEIKWEIIVCDNTAPVIKINNIKEGNKYLKIEKIHYEIIDNFIGDVKTAIFLNDLPYNDEAITEVGNYTLKIEATDEAGNTSEKQVSFKIIENNVIGCGDDFDCYFDNYLVVVIIVTILMVLIITILIIKICAWRIKKRVK